MKSNCDTCIKKDVCRWVWKMKIFANEMDNMFEYPEWNNINEILKTSIKRCKFYETEVTKE